MPELDVRRKYTYSKKRKKKEKLVTSVLSGLLPWRGDAISDVIRKVVFLLSLVALVVSLLIIIDFYYGPQDGVTEPDVWGAIVNDKPDTRVVFNMHSQSDSQDGGDAVEVEVIEKYIEFYERNNDFVGYLSIDPYINYPVAQKDDNSYYLEHNFDNVPTANGTIFADFEGVFTATERPNNTILYGHNLLTKNGFQPLLKYRKNDGFEFLKENPVIKFDTLYETGTYKIFSVFLTNTLEQHGEVFDYWNSVYFNSEGEFYDFVTECLDRSFYHTGVDLEYGDELLTLSTCDFSALSDLRLVVVARRVREYEDPRADVETFIDNKGTDEGGLLKYKMFDSYYSILNGGRGWAGRNWDTSLVNGLDEYLRSTR